MNATQQGINIKATAWTVGVHVLLLLLFFFIKYNTSTEEPIQELGMEVNLGTDADGSGTDQPMVTEDPAPDNREAAQTIAAAAQETNTEKEVLKTEEPDAPVINTKPTEAKKPVRNNVAETKPKPQTKPTTATVQPTQPKPQQPRYVYNGGTGKGGNSAAINKPGTGEGNTTGNGDRGVPGGAPGASNYTGTQGRGGISYNLTGRSIVAYPPPDADFKEGGKVVIRITVNKDGAIVSKQVKSATNAEIRAIALRKADKIKFNKSESAPEEQFGDVTFVFKTRS
jgi:outer membrane biosynthesis protein TonB